MCFIQSPLKNMVLSALQGISLEIISKSRSQENIQALIVFISPVGRTLRGFPLYVDQ
nr:MAG TPA: hypothetical protein [Caudoviricetes sp.]